MFLGGSLLKDSTARSRSIAVQETDDVIRQGIPMMEIIGLYGQRMLAFANLEDSAVVGELPKTFTLTHDLARNPLGTVEDLDGQLMQGVQPVLFVSQSYVNDAGFPVNSLWRIRGVPLPPKPEPFTVAHLGGDRWLAKGGTETFLNKWVVEDPGYESRTTVNVADAELQGVSGWIVLRVFGAQANPDNFWSNFVPSSMALVMVSKLEHDYTLSVEPLPNGSSSASYGMFPIAWVSAPDAENPMPTIVPARGWGNPLPLKVAPERFNYSDSFV
jgi:hypothetical protein